jgi:hypothetical protein
VSRVAIIMEAFGFKPFKQFKSFKLLPIRSR